MKNNILKKFSHNHFHGIYFFCMFGHLLKNPIFSLFLWRYNDAVFFT